MIGFSYQLVEEVAKELYIRALKFLPPDVTAALEKAYYADSGCLLAGTGNVGETAKAIA